VQEGSVLLKIILVAENEISKYEVYLKHGEYQFATVFNKIKDKVQADRSQIQSGKKTLILVDLFENSQFG
jgi:hypothetical protein